MNLEQKKARVAEIDRQIAAARAPGAYVNTLNSERTRLERDIAWEEAEQQGWPTPANALARQEGGNHYKTMGMQPVEFAMRNDLDPCAFSILKYVSRHRSKAGLQDVRKGRHFVDLREEFIKECVPADLPLPMSVYIEANGITGKDAEALLALEGWIACRLPGTTVAHLIDEIAASYDLPSS